MKNRPELWAAPLWSFVLALLGGVCWVHFCSYYRQLDCAMDGETIVMAILLGFDAIFFSFVALLLAVVSLPGELFK